MICRRPACSGRLAGCCSAASQTLSPAPPFSRDRHAMLVIDLSVIDDLAHMGYPRSQILLAMLAAHREILARSPQFQRDPVSPDLNSVLDCITRVSVSEEVPEASSRAVSLGKSKGSLQDRRAIDNLLRRLDAFTPAATCAQLLEVIAARMQQSSQVVLDKEDNSIWTVAELASSSFAFTLLQLLKTRPDMLVTQKTLPHLCAVLSNTLFFRMWPSDAKSAATCNSIVTSVVSLLRSSSLVLHHHHQQQQQEQTELLDGSGTNDFLTEYFDHVVGVFLAMVVPRNFVPVVQPHAPSSPVAAASLSLLECQYCLQLAADFVESVMKRAEFVDLKTAMDSASSELEEELSALDADNVYRMTSLQAEIVEVSERLEKHGSVDIDAASPQLIQNFQEVSNHLDRLQEELASVEKEFQASKSSLESRLAEIARARSAVVDTFPDLVQHSVVLAASVREAAGALSRNLWLELESVIELVSLRSDLEDPAGAAYSCNAILDKLREALKELARC